MTNININFANNTIEMTERFAKQAGKYGSKEYKELMAAKNDFPTYNVVTVKSKKEKSSNSNKGLTYDLMEKYIAARDNATKLMAEYRELRALDEKGKAIPGEEGLGYAEMVGWFNDQFPEFEERRQKRQDIIAKAAQKKAVKAEAKNNIIQFYKNNDEKKAINE